MAISWRAVRGGALGVQQLPWRRPGKQCHACGGAAKILCPNDLFGCWSYVAYYDVAGHQRACPHAPCSCSESRCDFLGSPPMLLAHLVADMCGCSEHDTREMGQEGITGVEHQR